MKKSLVLALLFLLFFAVQINGQDHVPLNKRIGVNPEVPRVSAYEAYALFKAGKTIILHAGGEVFRKRHIMGAFNLEQILENLDEGEDNIKVKIFSKLPKEGIQILIYCY